MDNSRQVKETKTKQITEQNKIADDKKAKEVADAKIMGGDGEVLSESGSEGDEYYTVMIMYEGIGTLGANANIMMQGDKLQNKAQMGCE